ncbi:hypothetical protein N658DRAFT_434922 [Parathielavia hyrcaniae]|uniref:Uncharacterized protein n=1 Tax=Parathielavia hyrcaniae TaxID=113614 RepID=A0AAN6PSK3_9PEZI|nr:hypothetical protein N658DRAFT_434922 [Parathielavia hyrcaniae]
MTPTQLPTWTHPVAKAVDDASQPPPAEVKGTIPPFHLHGERNCGDHVHDPKASHIARYLARHGGNRDPSSAWNLPCTNCHARTTLNQLHDLPCGDLICRDCLLVKALTAKLSIERNHAKLHDVRVQLVENHNAFFYPPSPLSARDKRMLLRRNAQLKRSMARLAGFTCCGADMQLGRFLPYMGAAASRELWLAIRWMSDDPRGHRACAWPDCGAYLPMCCRYVVPGEAGRRWYCVTCQGNSMDCARSLHAAQSKFPYLPSGQPALTPCR